MSDLTINIEGVTYEWFGGLGCVVRSYERGIKNGDVRIIHDGMFYARVYQVGWLRTPEISWVPAFEEDQCLDFIRSFKKRLFHCED